MLLLLVGSWLAWFQVSERRRTALRFAWIISFAPFAALFVCEATRGSDVRYLLRTLAELVPGRRVTPQGSGRRVVVLLLAIMGWGAAGTVCLRAREDDRTCLR